jgi:hypothetical protein
LKEYEALDKIYVSLRPLLEVRKSTQEEIDRTWAGVQAKLAARKKARLSLKARISDWLSNQYKICLPRIKPAPVFGLIIFLIGGFLYLNVISSNQPIILSSMVIHGTVKVWKEKDVLTLEPEIGKELLINMGRNQRIRVKTPNAEIEAGDNTQLYLKPEIDGPTAVGVVYAYDRVGLLTKQNNLYLSSGTTAYIYPDGTVSKPHNIPESQLKKWQEELENKSREK